MSKKQTSNYSRYTVEVFNLKGEKIDPTSYTVRRSEHPEIYRMLEEVKIRKTEQGR